MLLQVLGTLEGLAAEATLVRFERDVDPDVGGDVVALDRAGVASLPAAHEVQVVGALSSDVSLTEVLLQNFVSFVKAVVEEARTHKEALSRVGSLTTQLPLA